MTPILQVRQYNRGAVLAVWAAAALPMAFAAWIVAPALAHGRSFAEALIVSLTVGLAWQFVLVVGLVGWEQRTLNPSVLRRALSLNAPSTSDGRRGGRLWWWAILLVLAIGALELASINPKPPVQRDFGLFMSSGDAHALLHGNWSMFAVIVAMAVFNTVLGEELLFRGLLLPRMAHAFGRADWVANAALFGVYHLHQPWTMPAAVVQGLMLAFTSKRYRSAWFGILGHSAQSVFFITVTLGLVLSG